MRWGLLASVFFIATFKFMFAPFTGSGLGLSFWHTYIACVAGGCVSAAVFYYSSELFIKISHNRKVRKIEELERQGLPYKAKKKFTRSNRAIIRVKRSLGIYGISFWAPFFLSVPIGSMIAAKFYGKLKQTFPLIILGMFINAFAMCGLAYLIF